MEIMEIQTKLLFVVTQFLSNSIQSCIDAHGYDSVIIDDVWNYEFNYVDKVTKLFADLK